MKQSQKCRSLYYLKSAEPKNTGFLNTLLNNMNKICFVVDRDRKIIFCNEYFTETCEWKCEDVSLKIISGIIPAEERKIFEKDLKIYFAGKISSEENLVSGLLTKSKKVKKVEWKFIPVNHKKGEIPAIICIGTDITETIEAKRKIKFQEYLLNQLDTAVIATDLNGKINYWNKYAEVLYQWKSEEVTGRNINEVTVPQIGKKTAEKIMAQMNKNGRWEGEFNVCRKDKTIFPAYVRNTNIYDHDGKPSGYLGISNNITNQKEAQEMLRTAETMLDLFIANNPALMWIKDEKGKYVFADKGTLKKFSLKKDDMIGKTDIEIFPEDTAEQFMSNDKFVLKNNKPLESIEFVTEPDGELFSFQTIKFPFSDSKGNKFVGGFGIDITEKEKAFNELKHQKLLLETILEHIPVMLVKFDSSGKINMFNKEAERILGWKLDEIRKYKNPMALFYPDEAQRRKAEEFIRRADSKWSEFKLIEKNGKYIYTQWANVKLPDGRIIGIGIDTTERMKGEKEKAFLLKKLSKNQKAQKELSKKILEIQEEEKASIARDLHDEIGQILTAVKMDLQSLSKEGFGEELKDKVFINSLHVDTVLNKIRNISFKLRPSVLDDLGFEPALRWMIDNHLRSTEIKPNLSFRNIKKRFDPNIEIGAYRIVQEAVTNARRHSYAKNVLIKINKNNKSLSLKIEDDGSGFDQLENVLKNGDEKFGILSMRERARLLGGSLKIESSPGNGTKISVNLPLNECIN